jgi:pyrroline-5-carboxylate reductase
VKADVSTFDKDKFTKYVEETVSSVGERVKASTHQMDKLKENIISKFEGEVKKTEKAKKVLKPKIAV